MPISAAAQQFLDIESVSENVVILKDGGLRVILMCSSVNLALKSADEQDAIIYQYQNFLNSLDFPLQIIVHSRKLNINPYLDTLRVRQQEEENDLLKIQIAEYTEFVKTFVETTNIMSKIFYITVPFNPIVLEKKGVMNKILKSIGLGKNNQEEEGADIFQEHKNQLWQRVETVISGLQHMGLRSVPLDTEELIELFYGLYNPSEFEQELKTEEAVT